ncbi:deoxyribonuclease [Echinococcus multilocularis]|uniref:60S acidic ribosomal protein P0 n=1 Tax=Echinococcus multilocularis TaxID=6211 RepID=A0A068Y9A4_ECHMU|nr:deoxyribonuclease [Echinococcus multilocularis]
MVQLTRRERKEQYFKKFSKILHNYDRCFVVCADNVRSKQMQQIRAALRGSAEIVFGKNTQMKKVINNQLMRDSRLEKLLPLLKENVGLVFTIRDLGEVRKALESNRLEAPAKAGTVAPCDVTVPALNTGLGPEKTSFFQALNIQTKITRGTIEILSDVPLIKKGQKVGQSEAVLLKMLKINPFDYGLQIRQVFDQGSVYGPEVLDITPEQIIEKFSRTATNLTSLGLGLGYPTFANIGYIVANGFRDLLAISVATDYTFKESEQIKEYLDNPSKFASAVTDAPVAAAEANAEDKGAAPTETKAPESEKEESESEGDMGFSLFD